MSCRGNTVLHDRKVGGSSPSPLAKISRMMSSPERQRVKGASGRYHEQETGSNTATPHHPSLIPSLSHKHLPMQRPVSVKRHAGDATLGRSYPLFVSDSFLNDLPEAGLPRMASTALRWAAKCHPFTHHQNPNTPKKTIKRLKGTPWIPCLSSALPHFPSRKCSKRHFNLLSEGVNTFYGQTNGSKCAHL